MAQRECSSPGSTFRHSPDSEGNVSAAITSSIDPEHSSPANRSKFLTYRILRDLPFDGEQCGSDKVKRVLQASFTKPGIFDFHAQISTNLNILYLGSSVGTQFVRSLQKAAMSVEREVVRNAWNIWNENTHVSLTPHGGTISGLRVTGFLLNRTRDKLRNMAPNAGGGWLTYDVRELKRMVHQWRNVETIENNWGNPTSPCEINGDNNINSTNATSERFYPCEQKNFDVVVHQLAVRVLGLAWR